jgi:Cytochrome P460
MRSVIYSLNSAMSALDVKRIERWRTIMRTRYLGTLVITASIASCGIATTLFAQDQTYQGKTCYPPEYTSSDEFILPKNFHEWVYVGSPLTPNALNGGMANFPEFHNVYIEPCSYEKYKQTNVFPEGTIFFKELQLTLPGQNPDGSRAEPSGRGYFPGPLNGADSTVKDTKRYAATGGWGYYNFNHHEPKAPTAKLKDKSECAFCHQASAKKDEVWTQFYPLLDK